MAGREGPVDIVFNPRKSFLILPFAELVGEVARGLRLAGSAQGSGGQEMKQALQFVFARYKRWVSPALPHSCRFVPTCSEYAMEAVELHGALARRLLAAGRLLRCHPFARAGYDPPPRRSDGTSFGNARPLGYRIILRWREQRLAPNGNLNLAEYRNPQQEPGGDKRNDDGVCRRPCADPDRPVFLFKKNRR